MPGLEIEGVGSFDVPDGKRLVLSIEEDAGVDILHRCGSYARCTTCRVEYLEGEPQRMTKAELNVLTKRGLLGQVRLSCQALCDHDMKVRVLMTVTSTGDGIPGGKPEPQITPLPEWVEKPALPDAVGTHACECGHPKMRKLPGGLFHCPACGSEVVPPGSARPSEKQLGLPGRLVDGRFGEAGAWLTTNGLRSGKRGAIGLTTTGPPGGPKSPPEG